MNAHETLLCSFAKCTAEALEFACHAFHIELSEQLHQKLLDGYRKLPAFPNVTSGLERAQAAEFRLYAFSNGLTSEVNPVLYHAGIRKIFARHYQRR